MARPRSAAHDVEHRGDGLVQDARPLRATHHGQDEPIGWQAERGTGGRRVAAAVDVEHGPAQRRSGDRRPRQRRVGERHRARRRASGGEPARPTGEPVVADDDDGDAEATRGEDRREARVATDRYHDPRPEVAQQPRRGPSTAHQLGEESEVATGQPPLQPADVEERVRERRLGEQSGLDAAPGADVVDRRRSVSVGDECLGDRQRRQHVPRRSSPGDDRERSGPAHRRRAPSSRAAI